MRVLSAASGPRDRAQHGTPNSPRPLTLAPSTTIWRSSAGRLPKLPLSRRCGEGPNSPATPPDAPRGSPATPLALEVLFASAPTAAPAAMFLEIVPVSCSTIWVTAAAPPSPTPALIWNATCCKSSQSDSAEHRGVCFIEKDWMEAAASPGDNLVTSSISSNSVPRCMNRMVFASAVGMLRKSQLGRCGHWTEE